MAARRSSRNTDNTLGWIALGLLCFVLWLLYKLVLGILIFVTNYWIVILICLSILGLFLLFDRYRQQKKDAERLACEQIAEEQKWILDETERKTKSALDKIRQQQAEAKRFEVEEIQKLSILQTKENERLQYIRKKAEDKNRHILFTIKERKRRIQLEKEATLWLVQYEKEEKLRLERHKQETALKLWQQQEEKAKRQREAEENYRLMLIEEEEDRRRTLRAMELRERQRQQKQDALKAANMRSCASCGKAYDCNEAVAKFAVGCDEFYPMSRNW